MGGLQMAYHQRSSISILFSLLILLSFSGCTLLWQVLHKLIKLLISNFASVLIIGNSRFLIDSKWGISVFGKISFALSLTNFFLLFINQVSMVLFPTLRQIKGNMLEKYYEMINMALGLILPIIYLLYLPLQFILSLWLPQYQESFKY